MLITGRTRAEYQAMFDLADDDLAGEILDVSAGASSFTAEACQAGARVTAVDPCYGWPHDELADTVAAGTRGAEQILTDSPHAFDWSWYGTPERHAHLRRTATSRFLLDKVANPQRYQAGALPALPFPEAAFDLVLCSHLLFTWAADLGEHWHRQALHELVRVSRRQVRVFPLVGKGDEGAPPFLRALVAELRDTGLDVVAHPVPLRFQRGAGHAMVITLPAPGTGL